MTLIERRTLDEVLARYELEPALRDVYVEGFFDQEVLSRCFLNSGQSERIVYQIDCVEIPDDCLKRQGLTDGNKQRVIALARELASAQIGCACKCLVDRDLDHWFGPLEQTPGLLWTEHCSMELYFFTDEILRDVLLIAAKAKIADWDKFVGSLTNSLRDLYAMRLADCELKWSMQWLPPQKHLVVEASCIRFASSEYTKRLLMKNGRHSRRADFASVFERWRSALSGDPRSHIRGHDLVETLVWAIRAFRGIKELASTIAIERIFLLSTSKMSGLLQQFY